MLGGRRPFGYWVIRPCTFKCLFLVESRPLAAGHIWTLHNFEDPDFVGKLGVCQDSDVEWLLPIWISGHPFSKFHFLFMQAFWEAVAPNLIIV